MHYCESPQFVFLANPKTATRSTLGFLGQHYKMELWRGLDGNKGTHAPGIPKRMKDWPSFTVVRNPYRRMASLFWTARHMPKFWHWEMERYLKATFRPQTRYGHADTIIKFEDIPDRFKALPFWPKKEFIHINNSKLKTHTRRGRKWDPMPDHEELLTDKIRKIIREKYACDFETFGYEK